MGLFKKEKKEDTSIKRPPEFRMRMAMSLIDDVEKDASVDNLARYNADNVEGLVNKLSTRSTAYRIARGHQKDLNRAVEIAENIKETDPNLKLEIDDEVITPDYIIARSYFVTGFIGFQVGGSITMRKAQEYFQKSYGIINDPLTMWNIAGCLYALSHDKHGGSVVSINGEKTQYSIFTSKKARKFTAEAYEKVIELDPNSQLAIEAAKIIEKMGF